MGGYSHPLPEPMDRSSTYTTFYATDNPKRALQCSSADSKLIFPVQSNQGIVHVAQHFLHIRDDNIIDNYCQTH